MPSERVTDLDTVLTTTRAVRRRLDFTRPVDRRVVLDCLTLALQAPSGGNAQDWRFVLVGDPDGKRALGEIYRRCYDRTVAAPLERDGYAADVAQGRLNPDDEGNARMLDGARRLAHHIGEAPWLVLACATRPDPARTGFGTVSAVYGSVYPAVWSFALALRSYGLATIITTLTLNEPEAVAELLGIPDGVTQCCLLPIAHPIGDPFAPARRKPVDEVVFAERWGGAL